VAIALIVNVRSRANRLHPDRIERLRSIVGSDGSVLALPELEAQTAAIRKLAERRPAAIAINGGDGTLHKTLTTLLSAWGDAALPPIVLLPGGTMNVVASSLGIVADPAETLRAAVAQVRSGAPLDTVSRHCLRIGAEHGFVFGNGFIASFLEEYYAEGRYDARRALWVCARMFASSALDGDYARRVLRPYRGRLLVDGQPFAEGSISSVAAATVREVGLGFKLNHRADEDPERFSVLSVRAPALQILLDVPAVFAGRGMSPARADSAIARSLRLEPDPSAAPMPYTIDGDLYRREGPLDVVLGPVIRFVRPPSAAKTVVGRLVGSKD
jgi:diacylglycerol kinase family enzyme